MLELRALLTAARAHRERDWLLILVAFWHGLRASEVLAIKAHDIRDGYLTVKRLKGSLKTKQPLLGHLDPLFNERRFVYEFIDGMQGNQRLFPISRVQFWRLVRTYALAAGIPAHRAHPHALKHSIAAQMIQSAGIENTRQWLGHKSISSTGEYLRVTDDRAASAVARALGALPV